MNVIIVDKKGYRSRDGREFPCGAVADLSDHLAAKLISYGIAAPVPAPEKKPVPRPVETAAIAPAQNAARQSGKAAKKTPPAVKGGDDA